MLVLLPEYRRPRASGCRDRRLGDCGVAGDAAMILAGVKLATEQLAA